MEKKILVGAAVTVALVAAAVLYYMFFMRGSGTITSFDDKSVSAALMSQLYSIANNKTLANTVGIGTAASNLPSAVNGTALVENGKPAILYVSADYCPFCAITRWGLVIALMRFGNFTSLHYMTSSATDSYPNTATFTFYNSSYSSALLSFISAEVSTTDGKPLQTLNALENATFDKYNMNSATIPTEIRGSIPFTDFANKSVQVGASVTPQAIKGMDWAEVAAMLHNSSSQVTQTIIGSANVYTAYICASNESLRYAAACNQSYIAKIRLPS